jgi:hypothetical protein
MLVVLNLAVQGRDLANMAGGVLVAGGAGFAQAVFDQGPATQNRGQRVFAFDGVSARAQEFVAVTVEFFHSRDVFRHILERVVAACLVAGMVGVSQEEISVR